LILRAFARIDPSELVAPGHANIDQASERNSFEEQLQDAQRFALISRLLAHGFNNQLMIIGSYAELVLDELPARDPKRANVERVIEASKRAATLAKKLLDSTPTSHGPAKFLRLNDFIEALEGTLHRSLGSRIELSVVGDGEKAWIRVNPLQLRQAIFDVAANSRDAMPMGGRFTITVSRAISGSDSAIPISLAPGRYVVIALSDSGVGMDQDICSRLFEPFFSTKSREGLRGTGLVMVRWLLRQNGGDVSVRSKVGKGTTVTLYLPELDCPEDLAVEQKDSFH
jgi:signal transduction histidine kinase